MLGSMPPFALVANVAVGGMLTGLVYGLMALGLSVIFGVVRIVNFAHGEMMTIAMYIAVVLFTAYKLDPLVMMVPIAAVLFVLGYALQAVLINPFVGRPGHGHTRRPRPGTCRPRRGSAGADDRLRPCCDNTCANILLARIGGPAALTEFWRSIGDAVTRLDHNEPELNRSQPGDPNDTTTPAAMANNLRRLVLGEVLSPDSRGRLIGWMVDCKTGGNRLRGGLPKDWKIGDKTGNNGKDASGDIAVAWPRPDAPVLLCAYTQGGFPTAPQLEAIFAAIGGMVGHRLG
jgi:hypothetical protein